MSRPSKYKEEMLDVIIELMREGASKTEVCAALDITFETFSQWMKDPNKEAFSDAVKRGELLSQAWWERKGRISLESRDFNYTGWYMNMKNRFNWADKQETKSENKTEVKDITARPPLTRDEWLAIHGMNSQ